MSARILFAIFTTLLIQFENGIARISTCESGRQLNVTELDYYVNTPEGINILEDEFKRIKDGKRRPWSTAELPENIGKNRYDDLLAYDETRVVLQSLPDDPNSDYINANYIDGQNREREYAATQGPLPNTVNDFWRLIWQLNATKIIMLANLFEHGKPKVEKYWPEESDTYGDIVVTLTSQYNFPRINHVVRDFLIQKEGITLPRTVRHFHYTGWPDLGVPEDRCSLLALIQQARKYNPDSNAPIVIHCSAGIGRTGTVILTDSMLQKAEQEGIVDFAGRLDHMRIQRVNVVEKKEQYTFAYNAVYDFFHGNETEEYLRIVDEEYKVVGNNSKLDSGTIAESTHNFPQG